MLKPILILMITACFASPPVPSSVLEVHGKAVAVTVFPISVNGNSYVEIIVARPSGNEQSRFIRVRLSVPIDRFDQWMTTLPSIRKFKVTRNSRMDSALTEFISELEEPPQPPGSDNQKTRAWVSITGSTQLNLPFGLVVPVFQSQDWPEAPVL